MQIIRFILGKIILFLNAVFVPKQIVFRSLEAQSALNEKTKGWTMYQLQTCPFCVKVRRQMKRLAIEIPFKDVAADPEAQKELMDGGKQDQVPCLRYLDSSGSVQWMYESSAINEFLGTLSS